MNHKRGKPKSKRAGCLWCKPHKHEAVAKVPRSPAALAVVTERPQRERVGTWLLDEWERFGELVVDTYDTRQDERFADDWDDIRLENERDALPSSSATPLRVKLAEVAA